jgi:hypothetical protein
MMEKRLSAKLQQRHEFEESNNVTELRNKVAMNSAASISKEKLSGRFDLVVSSKVPIITKINKFSNEPLAYHLHKNRKFF